ncbi:unnamed protein product [Caenorhabditis angaria]|uniref:Uncharacterized protein n=1 Tax=Caenorhabditis angaria TaxID=860376 RepID=A0A9P1N8A7_9PELO|nr:unnamed protein product [Caenorhabditis angaria]
MPFGQKHARFGDAKSRMEDRSRVLTMKYGKQQMALIRKRMQVENWIETEVTKLFSGNENNNVDIDLDVIQDIDDVAGKRKYAFEQLQKGHCPSSMDKIIVFLDELIEQLNTL